MSLNLRYARQVRQQRRSGARRQWLKKHGMLWLNARVRAVSAYRGYYRAAQDMYQEDRVWHDKTLATLTAELAATRQTIERVEAIPERWAEVIDATMADAMRTPSTTADKAMAGGICEVIRCCANELRAALETPEGENDGEVDK